MTFFGLLPSSAFITASSARTAASISAFPASRATVTSARFLPLICTGKVMVFSTKSSGSSWGQASAETRVLWPSAAQHSSARCGIIGWNRRTRMSPASRNRPGEIGRRRRLGRTDTIRKRIGELVDMRDAAVEAQPGDIVGDVGQSAVGGLAHFERFRTECRGAAAGAATSAISPTSRHSRCTKRQAPCTPSSVQITSRSGGESDSMNQRAVSAP